MAKREPIKRAVERKTAEFQRLFIDDLNLVKKQFDLVKRNPPADIVLPRYAGQATVALVLAKRINSTWQALQVCPCFPMFCFHAAIPLQAEPYILALLRLHFACTACQHNVVKASECKMPTSIWKL